MLDPSRLGAMLLRQWNIPEQIWQTIEYQAYPAFCHPLEVPSDLRVNIALLYVAHAACDYLNHGAVGAFNDHPYLDRYLRLLRLKFNSDQPVMARKPAWMRSYFSKMPKR